MNKQDKMLKDLGDTLRKMKPERVERLMVKSEWIHMRITPADKEDLQAAAKACGLTVSEYLVRMHYLVRGRLFGQRLHEVSNNEEAQE